MVRKHRKVTVSAHQASLMLPIFRQVKFILCRKAQKALLYGLGDIASRRRFIKDADTSSDHQRREHKRLDSLIAYCESPVCRRIGLLAYFGEKAEPCGNCDICLNPVEMADGSKEGQMVLSAVYRTGQRFGAAHIIDILRGSDTEKVRASGHDKLPTFGVGADRKKGEWQSIIRQLVASGFLELDMEGFGGLALTEQGAELLKGDAVFSYRVDTLRSPAKAQRKTRQQSQAAELTSDQAELLARLKQLRLSLAKARQVPAYVIFPDRTLIDIAIKAPVNKAEVAKVNGVGAAKLRDLAEPFLEVVTNYTR